MTTPATMMLLLAMFCTPASTALALNQLPVKTLAYAQSTSMDFNWDKPKDHVQSYKTGDRTAINRKSGSRKTARSAHSKARTKTTRKSSRSKKNAGMKLNVAIPL